MVSTMDVIPFDDPGSPDDAGSFAARVRPVLAAHRSQTSVMASWMANAVAGQTQPPTRYWLVVDGGCVLGGAMLTAGHGLVLTPIGSDRVSEVLAALVAAVGVVPGAMGSPAVVECFGSLFTAVHGGRSKVAMQQLVYEIGAAPALPGEVPGGARWSRAEDLSLLSDWYRAFSREAHRVPESDEAVAASIAKLAWQGVMVWEREGRLVALAGMNGPALGLARIGPVYTPPRFRGRGFGGAVTAAVTRKAFSDGADLCMLYTDAANPTSNRVYSRLGYRPVGRSVMVTFSA